MSTDGSQKKKGAADFARACRYLIPYWRIVTVSILCAIFVSVAFTGGLGSLLPIMRVLLNGQTVSQWADAQIVEKRLGVKLADVADVVKILHLDKNGAAAREGLRDFDQVTAVAGAPATAPEILHALSDPVLSSAALTVERVGSKPVLLAIPLPPEAGYWQVLRAVAGHVPNHPVGAIATVLGAVVALAIASNVVKYFQEHLSDKAAILAIHDIRRRLYDHVLHVPLSHFGSKGTSDVTSRLVQDAQGLSEGFKTVLGQSIQEPIKAAMAFGLALIVSWKLTMFVVIFAPLMLAIIKKFGKKMRRASRKALVSSAVMLGQIEATLAGIRVVKGASAERFERRRYTRIMEGFVEEQLKMSRIDAFSAPTMETLTLIVVAIIVLFAANMVLITHTMSATSFFLVMACLGGIGDSLRRVSKVNNVLQKSNAAAARIFEVLDLPIERSRVQPSSIRRASSAATPGIATGEEKRGRINLPPLQQEVRFENVTFTYPNSSAPALVDVSLAVPKGRSVAIVGRNGSGKTTLLALLPRFYSPETGRILIDGIDIRDASLRSLRGQISIVTQDSVIFPGTIAQNIAYGDPLTGREEIMSAARRAFAHDFILEKPQGYDTPLGGLGSQLSGGQKQRLCIARAILRKSPILVLDEATSQVDAESEHLIQQAIEGVMHERTTFVIAHRFSTILSSDSIVVMDRGRIVGLGSHDELLRTCETYQQLYERQLFGAPPTAGPQPADLNEKSLVVGVRQEIT